MSLNVCVIVDDLYMYAVTAAAVEIIGKENPTTKELETMQIKEKKSKIIKHTTTHHDI